MSMNLRSDQTFVEDEGWHQAAERYEQFIACLPDLPSLKLVEYQRAEALQAAVEREAQASPEIQALMAQFDAKVRTVRPRGAPQAPGAR